MAKIYIREARKVVKQEVSECYGGDITAAIENSSLGGRHMRTIPCDVKYRILTQRGWQMLLDYSGVDRKKYCSDFFDCDNFAVMFSALCADKFQVNSAGIVLDFSGGHAYCAVPIRQPDGSIEIGLIEPQNDRFVIGGGGMYAGKFGVAIFA